MSDDLITALRACVDAMRRSDPTYCDALRVEQVSDVQWDLALALGENALDAPREAPQALIEALELIAAPRRPDGSWNRDREACRQLAADALGGRASMAGHCPYIRTRGATHYCELAQDDSLRRAARDAVLLLEALPDDLGRGSWTGFRVQAIAALREALAAALIIPPKITADKTQADPELSAALGWPGGISNPVLDRTQLLQMVAVLRVAQQPALEPVAWMPASVEHRFRDALELIAAPRRPDGSWNRDREACRRLAVEALAATVEGKK